MNDIETELRRGFIQMVVLSLTGREIYGYDLARQLEERGFRIDEGTLYPLLRRLEERGLLESVWNTQGSHPRKYYRITVHGQFALEELKRMWNRYNQIIDAIVWGEAKPPVKTDFKD